MKRSILFALLTVFAATTFTPMAAVAGSTGRRNTAIALTAATVYTAAKHKDTQALVLGAGSVYAWKKYNDSRHREIRKRAYRSGYRRGYRVARHHRHARTCMARR